MTEYKSAADSARLIRQALKSQLGLTSKDVSVRCSNFANGSAVDLTIKTASASFSAVKAIAEREESIRRCEFSGEILSGGNRYVDVRIDYELEESVARLYLPMLQALPILGSVASWSGPFVATSTGLDKVEQFDGATVLVRRVEVDRFDLSMTPGCWRDLRNLNAVTTAHSIAGFALRQS